jgi:4-hydroxyphenylpyruvate dioxygenase
MADQASHANDPLGLDGFEFCEFTSPNPQEMSEKFERLGFVPASIHPTKDIVRYKQGRINLLLNRETTGQGSDFRAAHGPSANGMAFRVKDAKQVFEYCLSQGAKAANAAAGALGEGSYVIEGIGGSNLYLIDLHGKRGSLYDSWKAVPGAAENEAKNSVGLDILDHLTHNVRRGQMRVWSSFYSKLFGFEEQKYFDIKGKATGLFSQAMIAPDRAIRIPLNESQDEKSQIEEFLRAYNGEGIQHLAFTTPNIYETVEKLYARHVGLQDTIETYYELVDKRVPGHGEDLARLKKNRILLDGNQEEGLLLQIFTENLFGPIFF